MGLLSGVDNRPTHVAFPKIREAEHDAAQHLIRYVAGMSHVASILYIFPIFDPEGADGWSRRAVRMMATIGDRARHTIAADEYRGALPADVRATLAQNPPPLTGAVSVARYEAIARALRGHDLVLTHGAGAIDAAMARRAFPRGAPPIVHHEDPAEATMGGSARLYRRIALGAAGGLVVSGDSAGGNLAIVVAAALRDRPAAVPVIVQAPIYPATDATRHYASFDSFADGYLLTRETMAWFGGQYRPVADDPRFSPLAGELAGLPPAVIVSAGLDPLRDQARAYAAALALAGVAVTYQEAAGNIHGFATLRRAIPSSQGDIAAFLDAVNAAVASAQRAQAAG